MNRIHVLAERWSHPPGQTHRRCSATRAHQDRLSLGAARFFDRDQAQPVGGQPDHGPAVAATPLVALGQEQADPVDGLAHDLVEDRTRPRQPGVADFLT